jgi:hypothetical protein
MRGGSPGIVRRDLESSRRLGRHRWKLQRLLAWLVANRCLTVRSERRDILTRLLQLAWGLLWVRPLDPLEESCFQSSPPRDTAVEFHRWWAIQPGWFLAGTKGPLPEGRRPASTRGWPHDSWPHEVGPARAVPPPGSPGGAG